MTSGIKESPKCHSFVGEDTKLSLNAIKRDLRWQSTQCNYSGNHNSAGKLIPHRSPKVDYLPFKVCVTASQTSHK